MDPSLPTPLLPETPMADPKSYRFPDDLLDAIEAHIAPNGPYPSRTAFFVEAAREKLLRLHVETAPPPVTRDERRAARFAELGVSPIPFYREGLSRVRIEKRLSDDTIDLTIGPNGVSDTLRLATRVDPAHVWQFMNLYTEMVEEGSPPHSIVLREVKIGGSSNLLPCEEVLVSSYAALEVGDGKHSPEIPHSLIVPMEFSFDQTHGLRANPILLAPNFATAEVTAYGAPGTTLLFRVFGVMRCLRDDAWIQG